MENQFERFGLEHLSASSLNLWEQAPDVWVARYLLNYRRSESAAMLRGTITESAVVSNLMGERVDLEAMWSVKMPYSLDAKAQKELAALPAFVAQATEALQPFGMPTFDFGVEQCKVETMLECEGFDMTVIGYLDFVFLELDLIIDLKTTHRMPSSMSAAHSRQAAIYQQAVGDDKEVKFLYVTPKKHKFMADFDTEEEVRKMTLQANRLNRFLAQCETAEEAAAIVPVNSDSFYWFGDEDIRMDIYGL